MTSNNISKINSDLHDLNSRLNEYIEELTNAINSLDPQYGGRLQSQSETSLQDTSPKKTTRTTRTTRTKPIVHRHNVNRVPERPPPNRSTLTTQSPQETSLDTTASTESHPGQSEGNGSDNGKIYKLTMKLENLNTKFNSAFSKYWNSPTQSSVNSLGSESSSQTAVATSLALSDDELPSQGWFDRLTTELEKLNIEINTAVSNHWNPRKIAPSLDSLSPEASAFGNTASNIVPQSDCIKCMDFTLVDLHASKFPRQFTTSIPQLAIDLTSTFSSKLEKARAIFIWLHCNIAYSIDSHLSGKTPEEILQSGKADNQGFAEIFSEIGNHSGLDVLVITGHCKGYGNAPVHNDSEIITPYNSNQFWNAVQLENGEWHLLDACLGAGYLDKSGQYVKHLTEEHFRTTSPEIFRMTHFPANPKYQMCAEEMSWYEYLTKNERDDAIEYYSEFSDYGFSEVKILPVMPIPLRGHEPTKFVVMTKCEHTRIQRQDQFLLLLSVEGKTTPFEVNSEGTVWTCEQQKRIKPGSEVCVCVVESIGGESAKGLSVQEYLSQKCLKPSEIVEMCKWDAWC